MKILPMSFAGKGHPGRMDRGFSMVEMLVTVTIILVLTALLAPTFRSVKQQAHNVRCLSNLRQISAAVNLYLAENNSIFPACVDYVPWRGMGVVEAKPHDIAFMLNPYLGSRSNLASMDYDIWVCPEGKKFGSRKPFDVAPYFLGKFGLPSAWGYKHNITYRWNSKTTRGINSMYGWGTGDMSASPQYANRLKTPAKAALMWDLPDNLAFYPGLGSPNLHGNGVNCLFVDGHVERVPVALTAWGDGIANPGTLWWYAGEWSFQGWAGAHVPGSDQ